MSQRHEKLKPLLKELFQLDQMATRHIVFQEEDKDSYVRSILEAVSG